jgi:hypothetical protein
MINTLKARRRGASPGRLYGSGRDKIFWEQPRQETKSKKGDILRCDGLPLAVLLKQTPRILTRRREGHRPGEINPIRGCSEFRFLATRQRKLWEKRVLMQVHEAQRGDICSAQRAHSNAVVGVDSPLAFSTKHRPFRA